MGRCIYPSGTWFEKSVPDFFLTFFVLHRNLQHIDALPDTLPKYHPRKSRSGKDLVPGLDMSRKF